MTNEDDDIVFLDWFEKTTGLTVAYKGPPIDELQDEFKHEGLKP